MFDELINSKWEIKTIGEIAEVELGKEITRTQLGTGNYPAIKCGDVNSGLSLHFTECISFVDPDLIENKKYFEYGDLLVGKIGNLKTAGTAAVYLGHDRCLLGDAVYRVKHNQNPKYLAYVWSSDFVRKQIESFYKAGTVFNFFIRELKQIKVPIPPRHIQDKIADYLDKLLSLKEELKERIKQYQYYLNLLIVGREEEGKRKGNLYHTQTIEKIAVDIYSGSEITKSQLKGIGYPAIRYCEIHSSNLFIKEYKDFVDIDEIKRKRYIEYGDLLIVNVSENLEDSGKAVAYLNESKCLAGNHVITIKHKQNPKYLAYATSTDFYKKQVKEYSKKGIVCDLAITRIKQIHIPLPSLEEQKEIVSKIDKFHELCGDISKGIPKLIEETEKQYQYYRDKIISH